MGSTRQHVGLLGRIRTSFQPRASSFPPRASGGRSGRVIPRASSTSELDGPIGGAMDGMAPMAAPEMVGEISGPIGNLNKVVTSVDSAANMGIMAGAMGAPVGLAVVKKGAGLVKNTKIVNKIEAIEGYWKTPIAGSVPNINFAPGENAYTTAKPGFFKKLLGQQEGPITRFDHVTNTAYAVSSGLSIYEVGKSFAEQLNALRHAIADIKGVPFESISSTAALMGPIPKSLEPARKHLQQEHLWRGVAQVAGLATLVWSIRAKKHLPMVAFMAPSMLDMGANQLLGESVLPAYAMIKNAYNAKQDIPAEMYAQFLLGASSELKKRETIGQMVAQKVGEQYAAEKTDPAVIMQEIDSGKFMQRVQGLIAEAEKAQAAQLAAAKAKQAEEEAKKAHPKMVDKISGKKSDLPVVGKHTQQLASQTPGTLAVT